YFLFACPYLPPALHSFPTRRSSDLAGAGEPVRHIMRGGLALDGGVERQDQLLDFATGRPRDQRVDAKILGSDTLERRERAAEHRSEEHTSELQSLAYLVCRLLLEKK